MLPILLIENERNLRDVLSSLLTGVGYRLTAVATLEEAQLHLDQSRQPLLLISDIDVEAEVTGPTFCRFALGFGYPVGGLILISGDLHLNDDVVQAREAFFHAGLPFFTLGKPFSFSQLTVPIDQAQLRHRHAVDPAGLGKQATPLASLHSNTARDVLRQARTTLTIPVDTLLGKLLRDMNVDPERAERMPASAWYRLCRLLELEPECLSFGYDAETHLRRVRDAIQAGSFAFPVSDSLRSRLAALDHDGADSAGTERKMNGA